MRKLKIRKTVVLGFILIIILSLIIAFLMFFPFEKKEVLKSYSKFSIMPSYVDDIPVYTKLISKDSKRRPNEKREIKYIVIHETDNTAKGAGSLKHSQFLLTNTDAVNGWHYTVDDKIIAHNLPDNEVSWHAGDKRKIDGGNINGIGIEICVNKDGDYEKAFINAVKLTAYLLYQYDLSVDSLKLHKDFSGKICPSRMIESNRVDEFYNKVQEEYNLKYIR